MLDAERKVKFGAWAGKLPKDGNALVFRIKRRTVVFTTVKVMAENPFLEKLTEALSGKATTARSFVVFVLFADLPFLFLVVAVGGMVGRRSQVWMDW